MMSQLGNLLQDEKMPGCHIAFGNTCPKQTDADWNCSTHIDVIATQCDIWFDGQQVMEKGKFLVLKIFATNKIFLDFHIYFQ
jgi:leucyl aminopeptidase (aminopeptidase T)